MTARPAPRFRSRPGQRLTIWLGVRDRYRHASLAVELVARARKAKLMGATVFEAQLGFGTGGQVHREHALTDDRSLAIVVVDAGDRIARFVEDATALAPGLLAVLQDVEIVEI